MNLLQKWMHLNAVDVKNSIIPQLPENLQYYIKKKETNKFKIQEILDKMTQNLFIYCMKEIEKYTKKDWKKYYNTYSSAYLFTIDPTFSELYEKELKLPLYISEYNFLYMTDQLIKKVNPLLEQMGYFIEIRDYRYDKLNVKLKYIKENREPTKEIEEYWYNKAKSEFINLQKKLVPKYISTYIIKNKNGEGRLYGNSGTRFGTF